MTDLSSPFARRSIRPGDGIVLYGAGHVGQDVCRVLTREGVHVVCFLDRSARVGDELEGIPVFRPESCPLTESDRARVPVILSIFNSRVDIPELALTLRGLGFRQLVSFVDLHADFFHELGDRYWLTRRSYVTEHLEEITEAEKMWGDEASRTLFRSLVTLRRTGYYDVALAPGANNPQYFPSDIPNWARRPLRIADCGAYNGDTLDTILKLGVPVEASAHFEPDPENFAKLASFVRDHRLEIEAPVALWPCAISNRCHVVSFRQGLSEGSSVGDDGHTNVQAVALDDVLQGWRPTFVKMDIEGAEVEGLLGARELIGRNRPDLAVCVYHRPDHLWHIPLLLRQWKELADYRYYLRAHAYDGFDIVLYACPDR
jgi:FkbM family methyltransferase